MAKLTYKGSSELAGKLDRLGAAVVPTVKKALYEAAGIVADKIRYNLQMLPEDQARVLQKGEVFRGVPPAQKKDLLDSLGMTKVSMDDKGYWNIKVGFSGYGTCQTRTYPKGVPNTLLARSIESGSIVRIKTPFSRPAVQATKKMSMIAMQDVINDTFEKT